MKEKWKLKIFQMLSMTIFKIDRYFLQVIGNLYTSTYTINPESGKYFFFFFSVVFFQENTAWHFTVYYLLDRDSH